MITGVGLERGRLLAANTLAALAPPPAIIFRDGGGVGGGEEAKFPPRLNASAAFTPVPAVRGYGCVGPFRRAAFRAASIASFRSADCLCHVTRLMLDVVSSPTGPPQSTHISDSWSRELEGSLPLTDVPPTCTPLSKKTTLSSASAAAPDGVT